MIKAAIGKKCHEKESNGQKGRKPRKWKRRTRQHSEKVCLPPVLPAPCCPQLLTSWPLAEFASYWLQHLTALSFTYKKTQMETLQTSAFPKHNGMLLCLLFVCLYLCFLILVSNICCVEVVRSHIYLRTFEGVHIIDMAHFSLSPSLSFSYHILFWHAGICCCVWFVTPQTQS